MRILYTGFKGKNNSSFQLLKELDSDKVLLTNSFEGLKRDILQIEGQYDLVVMFGLDKSLKSEVRIESNAEDEGYRIFTDIDLKIFRDVFMKNGVGFRISATPAPYLCNAAYYHMLKRMNGKAVFIHIPTTKNMDDGFRKILIQCIREL